MNIIVPYCNPHKGDQTPKRRCGSISSIPKDAVGENGEVPTQYYNLQQGAPSEHPPQEGEGDAVEAELPDGRQVTHGDG